MRLSAACPLLCPQCQPCLEAFLVVTVGKARCHSAPHSARGHLAPDGERHPWRSPLHAGSQDSRGLRHPPVHADGGSSWAGSPRPGLGRAYVPSGERDCLGWMSDLLVRPPSGPCTHIRCGLCLLPIRSPQGRAEQSAGTHGPEVSDNHPRMVAACRFLTENRSRGLKTTQWHLFAPCWLGSHTCSDPKPH